MGFHSMSKGPREADHYFSVTASRPLVYLHGCSNSPPSRKLRTSPACFMCDSMGKFYIVQNRTTFFHCGVEGTFRGGHIHTRVVIKEN